jgi:two-component system sensor histidine kinase BaeS
MRLSISKKISLSLLLVLVLSIVSMAWLTSKSLQSGFNNYLKEKQLIDLDKVALALSRYYAEHGDFRNLRHNPNVVRPLIDAALGRVPDRAEVADPDEDRPPPEQARAERRRPPPARRTPAMLDLGPRLSLIDDRGNPVFGPLRSEISVLRKPVMSGDQVVGVVLAPLPKFTFEKTTLDFVRSQLNQLFFLAIGMIALATLISFWLGRHLVRPIANLRKVTQQIASGQLAARAEVLNQDEMGDLAQHINVMAKHLEASDHKRKKLMADLSHELRTPLTVMRAEVEAVIDGVRPLNMASIHSLEAEIHHLNKLVDDLHQLALVDAGDLRFQFIELNVAELLADIGQRFQARMQAAQLTLQIDVPSRQVMMRADSGRLTQVIENLLENSLRYTDAGGQVLLRLTQQAGLLNICIEDSAPGLEAGQHQHMFERLYRGDQARSRLSGGSGLGLSICRSLVLAHRGEIHASASALGGVKMNLLFPTLE